MSKQSVAGGAKPLQEVYYAQQELQRRTAGGRRAWRNWGWRPRQQNPSGAPKLTATADGYLCALDLGLPGGKRQQ